ncbi:MULTISPECIES: type VI secretion system ATPase TssH [unclassified Burkholderia]|uniref:type VI secretion system ATPase TssH n=1 Tax=unclassified Burkholderia TaxID=2613784 RepID=UPI0007582315|nr:MULTISPECIES: type VI secretion system ATPase TssH [unclassified Burkholderia]KVN12763.1 ClpV1 family T6SS ATPase [Burkholderia sp. MSMB1552]KWZ49390.1 ClpV1 family T6SS ATPase [Burkholderia sp. MSMB1588]
MNRERIFNCLGRTTYAALVDATALGRSRRHAFIDLDHWALCLLQREQSDLARLFEQFGSDVGEAKRRMEKALDGFDVSGDSLRDISSSLERSVGPAVIWSQIAARAAKVRSGHLLLAWLDEDLTRRWLQQRVPSGITSVALDEVVKRYEALAAGWPETDEAPAAAGGGALGEHAGEAGAEGASDALAKWATCVTEQAARGELDPVVGRDDELRTVIDILSRRRQNNPILVGEAGVGKTAVVEALAQKIHAGAVPPGLIGAQVWALDLARMQAGAGVRGEFEQRLKSLIDAVIASPAPIILFCDETHTLIGAGGAAGTGDAANLIKPMLARGQLRMVAATTWSEYKQYIEPDAALVRRFQAVPVDEPGDDAAVDMLRTIAPRFAAHHGVRIVDSALRGAVELSRRYLPARQLPDKAISLLDTACARVAMSQNCAPAELERLRHQAFAIGQTLDWRASDRRMGVRTPGDEAGLEGRRASLVQQASTLETVVGAQRDEVRSWLARLNDETHVSADSDGDGDSFAARIGANRWVRPWVDEHVVSEVLAEWTGVPVAQLAQDDAQRVVELEGALNAGIHGQTGAMRSIAQALQVSHSGLNDPRRPLGVMLLAGPTGTGKSQAAAKLAELLFGGERNLLQFNMNEFQEAHTVSTLKGAPPGYVGYGKGGRLTEAVRKKPYSVLLLDEFDRAHPDIHEVFYQVFDQGWMEDGEGRRISFRNCLILLTSNLGDVEIEAACKADPRISQAKLDKLVGERLQGRFSPALLARIQLVAFRPLDVDALTGVATQALDELGERLAENDLQWRADEGVASWVAHAVSQHPANGRAVRDLLRQHVMPAVARGVLAARAEGRALKTVRLAAHEKLSLVFDEDAWELSGTDAAALGEQADAAAREAAAAAQARDAHEDAHGTPESHDAHEAIGGARADAGDEPQADAHRSDETTSANAGTTGEPSCV